MQRALFLSLLFLSAVLGRAAQGIKDLQLAGTANQLNASAVLTLKGTSQILAESGAIVDLSLATITLPAAFATDAEVTAALALKANLASPALTGTPTAPTAAADTSTTQIATTAFAKAEADAAQSASQPLDSDLTSIAGNATGGFLTRTASNTYTARTITGTAGQITVTNGDGVSGAPTLSLPSTITQATAFSAGLNLTGAAATNRDFSFQTGGVNRWVVRADNTAESGSDAGSYFTIRAYTDAGAAIDNPLYIVRAAGGGINLARPLAVNSTTASTSTTTGSATFSGGIGVAGAINAGSASAITYSGASPVLALTANSGAAGRDVMAVLNNGTGAAAYAGITLKSEGTNIGRLANYGTSYGTALVQGGTLLMNDTGPVGLMAHGAAGKILFMQGSAFTEIARFAPTSNSLLLGTTTDSSNGRLQLATHTSNAGGIGFGTDFSLYSLNGTSMQVLPAINTAMNFDVLRSAGQVGYFRVMDRGGNRRWALGGNATSESGSNAGTDFQILSYSDANAFIDAPVTIARVAGGAVTIARPLSVTNSTAATSTTTGSGIFSGGIGVAGEGWFGGNVKIGDTRAYGWATDTTMVRSSANNVTLDASLNLLGTVTSAGNLVVRDTGGTAIGAGYRMTNASNTNEWRWGFRDTGGTLGSGLYFSAYNGATWSGSLRLNNDGTANLPATTASTSTITGAFTIGGGLGVAGRSSTATINVGGTNGTTADLIASNTATLDFGSIAAAASADLTITVTGASTGDSVSLGLPAAPTAGIIFQGFVSASNTVTVRATNITGSPVDPASATYRATVTSF
jgi:hypothetical protein